MISLNYKQVCRLATKLQKITKCSKITYKYLTKQITRIQTNDKNIYDNKDNEEIDNLIKWTGSYIDMVNMISGRRQPFPEKISENISKLILKYRGYPNIKWCKDTNRHG